MKNYVIIIAASVCCLLYGCTKTVKDDGSDMDISGFTLLRASVENLALAGYDPSTALWSNGDKVAVFGEGQTRAICWDMRISSDGRAEAEFYGPLVRGDKIFGVFPYDTSLEFNGEAVTCELPGIQRYCTEQSVTERFIAHNPYVYGLSDNGIIDFHYAFGMLEISFDLANPVEIKELAVKSEKSFLSGRMLYDGTQLYGTGASANSITLDLGGEIFNSTGLTVGIVIPPAIYDDLIVDLTLSNDDRISLKIPQTEIRRIDSTNFEIGHITISLSDLPDLEQEDGYWEENR